MVSPTGAAGRTVPGSRRPVRTAATAPSRLARIARPAFAVLVATALVAGVTGGLLRAGVAWPAWGSDAVLGQALSMHAALMLSGFLGTVIGVERAVALRLRGAWVAPVASGAAGLLMLADQVQAGAWLGVLAALAFVAVNAVVVKWQAAAHTGLLLVGALAWLVGNLLFATGLGAGATLAWWFAFPVLTIAAERLEMTRLMRRHALSHPSLLAIVATLLAGATVMIGASPAGGTLYGAALIALAAWLGCFDVARRTVTAHGLSRYMAVCLLSGYAWLGVAGLAWIGMAYGCPGRDLAFHALGLGFIVSMVMGHAPVILPAVARIRLAFGPWFYAPLALLHASLLLRLVGGIGNPQMRTTGVVLNAVALALFAVTVAGSALAWRRRHGNAAPDAR